MSQKQQIKSKIAEVLVKSGDFLENSAKSIAPDFDYERELKLRKILAASIFIIFCAISLFVSYLFPTHIKIHVLEFNKDEIIKELDTRSLSVSGALRQAGIIVNSHDYVTPSPILPPSESHDIYVRRAIKTEAVIKTKPQEFYLVPGTVEINLAANAIKRDSNDIAEPARADQVTPDTKIVFNEVHYKYYDKQEIEPAKSLVVLDPKMESGVEKRTDGEDGEGIFTYYTCYINGKESGTERKVKKWIKKPIDNQLRLGTSLTGHNGEYAVDWEFTAETTAYYMGESAVGAAGGHCVYGTCAVDPNYIPYGSWIWVEGYGLAVANDCGGGIKNQDLDLWMDTFDKSCQWGRQWVKAYVLKDLQ